MERMKGDKLDEKREAKLLRVDRRKATRVECIVCMRPGSNYFLLACSASGGGARESYMRC
jgi:hypothetical protein